MNFIKTTTLLLISSVFLLLSCENTKEEDVTVLSEEQTVKLGGLNATINVQAGGNFGNRLMNAVNSANAGDIIKIPSGSHKLDRALIFPNKRVIIQGAGRGVTWIDLERPGQRGGLFFIGGDNTVIENLSINAKNRLGPSHCAININGKVNVVIKNVHIRNASRAISTTNTSDRFGGKLMHGMRVIRCDFLNCARGIEFNRKYNFHPVSKMQKWTIDGCTFRGSQLAGITIDCGNDGADGPGGDPNFPFCGAGGIRSLPRAREAQNTVTDFSGSVIKNCTFDPSTRYNVAVAKVSNISIVDNIMRGNTGVVAGTNRAFNFAENINIEHEARNIFIARNRISNENRNNQEMAYISVISFSAYCNAPLFENGCRNITIRNNDFSGRVGAGINGEFADRVTINNNRFNNPRPTGRIINFFRGNRVAGISQFDNFIPNNKVFIR